MDIELGRWCDTEDPNNAQFVVQPWDFEGNRVRFPIELTDEDNDMTFLMCWQPGVVMFSAYRHHHFDVPPPEDLVFIWAREGEGVPEPGEERIRINFWLVEGNLPLGGEGAEFAVTHFSYSPECFPPPGPSPDINGDGAVNDADLLELMRAYHQPDERCDFHPDGIVDSWDLYMFCRDWQKNGL
jgi:hypothetical protein